MCCSLKFKNSNNAEHLLHVCFSHVCPFVVGVWKTSSAPSVVLPHAKHCGVVFAAGVVRCDIVIEWRMALSSLFVMCWHFPSIFPRVLLVSSTVSPWAWTSAILVHQLMMFCNGESFWSIGNGAIVGNVLMSLHDSLVMALRMLRIWSEPSSSL